MFKPAEVVTILGKRGSGKSTLARHIQRAYPRRVVFDLLGEHQGERGPEVFHVATFAGLGQAVKQTLEAREFKIVVAIDLRDPHREAFFEEAMILCYERKKICPVQSSIQLVIDECHEYASAHHMPDPLKQALLLGRHQDMGLILASQRPANVHKDILAQSHHLFCAQIVETNDFNYLKGYFGAEPDRLKSLGKFEFLHKSDEHPLGVVKVTPLK